MTTSEDSRSDISTRGQVASLPALALRPRDEHFTVIVTGRPARAGHTPFQIAIPQELYRRLRYESLGSTNQVMVALVRQALSWLDTDRLTLHAEAHPGSQPASLERARAIPDSLAGAGRREFERSLDELWPNARLSTRPREDRHVVMQVERQPRADAQLTQIALPPEVHQRLLHDGVGAISQLVISLARYAIRRLDEENLTLDVMSVDANASGTMALAGTETINAPSVPVADPSLTVAQLIHELSKQPLEAFVVFEEQKECWWNLQQVALTHLSTGNPYDGFLPPDEQSDTPIVVLRGEASAINEPPEEGSDFLDL